MLYILHRKEEQQPISCRRLTVTKQRSKRWLPLYFQAHHHHCHASCACQGMGTTATNQKVGNRVYMYYLAIKKARASKHFLYRQYSVSLFFFKPFWQLHTYTERRESSEDTEINLGVFYRKSI